MNGIITGAIGELGSRPSLKGSDVVERWTDGEQKGGMNDSSFGTDRPQPAPCALS